MHKQQVTGIIFRGKRDRLLRNKRSKDINYDQILV